MAVSFPDSALARRAGQLLVDTSPPQLVNHCLRSYLWAVALADVDGLRYDPELLYVAAALHDLGLLDEFDTGRDFEVDGGRVAARLVRDAGEPEQRAALVAEAIELHVAVDVEVEDGTEAFLLWHATGIDVAGGRYAELPQPLVAATLEQLPRLDFQPGFGALFARQAERKPRSRAGELVTGGLLERMSRSPLDGYAAAART